MAARSRPSSSFSFFIVPPRSSSGRRMKATPASDCTPMRTTRLVGLCYSRWWRSARARLHPPRSASARPGARTSSGWTRRSRSLPMSPSRTGWFPATAPTGSPTPPSPGKSKSCSRRAGRQTPDEAGAGSPRQSASVSVAVPTKSDKHVDLSSLHGLVDTLGASGRFGSARGLPTAMEITPNTPRARCGRAPGRVVMRFPASAAR